MVIFPIWKFPNGFIMDSPERIFISTEKCCDVVYTHSHKLSIILETAVEKWPLNDIIALKTKKIHISVDTVGVYCYMWKDKWCFLLLSLTYTKLLIDHMGLSRGKWSYKYTSMLSSDKQRHPKQGYKWLWITESCLWNNCSAHEKAFNSLGQEPSSGHFQNILLHTII